MRSSALLAVVWLMSVQSSLSFLSVIKMKKLKTIAATSKPCDRKARVIELKSVYTVCLRKVCKVYLPSAGVRLSDNMTRANRSHSSWVEYEGNFGGSLKPLISVEQSSNFGRKSVSFSCKLAAKKTNTSLFITIGTHFQWILCVNTTFQSCEDSRKRNNINKWI